MLSPARRRKGAKMKAIICGGGTVGHLTPGISILIVYTIMLKPLAVMVNELYKEGIAGVLETGI